MKTINLNKTFDIKGIYVTPANKIIGIPLFRQNGQEYREYPKRVELWEKNGDGRMHLQKRWMNKSITHIEYTDLPNIWVEPRALKRK